MANDLEPYENITRVFWIKIELKEDQRTGRQNIGEIRDVKSGAKQPIYKLRHIVYFLIPYLEKMGIKTSLFWRLGRRLERTRSKHPSVLANSTSEESEYRHQP